MFITQAQNMQTLYKKFLESSGVCTDTRQIEKNSIFFALKGDNFDGNTFVHQALEKGCLLAITDNPEISEEKIIVVENVLLCLQKLANYHRLQFNIPVIGITGSNGKTTSKELIGSVLSAKYNCLITSGNLNNHIGVPLTLLKLKAEHNLAIIEMGANKPGDIKELAEIAEPDYGLLTNVGRAHLEGFGSLEGVIKTKKELYDFIIKKQGTIFCNAQDDTLRNLLKNYEKVIYYGNVNSLVDGNVIKSTPFLSINWQTGQNKSEFDTQLIGAYNLPNFLAAICIGVHFGVNQASINQQLAGYTPGNNRSQVVISSNNTIIVDCYNANPTSMEAALKSFALIENQDKLAILGDMLELGNESAGEHQKIIRLASDLKIAAWYIGKEFSAANSTEITFLNIDELNKHLKTNTLKGKTLLLKGSRGIKLEESLKNGLI